MPALSASCENLSNLTLTSAPAMALYVVRNHGSNGLSELSPTVGRSRDTGH